MRSVGPTTALGTGFSQTIAIRSCPTARRKVTIVIQRVVGVRGFTPGYRDVGPTDRRGWKNAL
jgi:hypothetical protein